jgi:hypothetical protein
MRSRVSARDDRSHRPDRLRGTVVALTPRFRLLDSASSCPIGLRFDEKPVP